MNGWETRWPVITALLTASLVIHGSLLFTFEQLVGLQENEIPVQKIAAGLKKDSPIAFQFVESTPITHPEKPLHTKKISNRDSLNQDALRDKPRTEKLPFVKTQGPSDQLAQKKGVVSRQASLDVKLSPGGDLSRQGELPVRPMPDSISLVEVKHSPIHGLTGGDNITTQEMARVESKGAKFYGLTSFEATGSGMGEYMKRLKEKIWLQWFPYLSFRYPRDFQTADAVVSVTLNAKGEAKILKVVESEGSPAFASFCLEAIQKASGFGPLPEEILALIGKNELEIRFGFHFR